MASTKKPDVVGLAKNLDKTLTRIQDLKKITRENHSEYSVLLEQALSLSTRVTTEVTEFARSFAAESAK